MAGSNRKDTFPKFRAANTNKFHKNSFHQRNKLPLNKVRSCFILNFAKDGEVRGWGRWEWFHFPCNLLDILLWSGVCPSLQPPAQTHSSTSHESIYNELFLIDSPPKPQEQELMYNNVRRGKQKVHVIYQQQQGRAGWSWALYLWGASSKCVTQQQRAELPFEPGFIFLTAEYSHAQNQLKQRHLTSFYAWRRFSITTLPVLTTKAVLSLFVFCTERWRAEVWQRRSSNGQSRQPILPRHLTERLTVSLYTWQAEAVVNIH